MQIAQRLSRREFLHVFSSGIGLAVLNACAPIAPTTVAAPTHTPIPPPRVPTAIPPTVTPSISPTPTIPLAKDPSSPMFLVAYQTSPKDPWQDRPTRTFLGLKDSENVTPDSNLDQYGGWQARAGSKTGFFHTEKIGERWWLIDPDGNLFIHKGITSVAPQDSPKSSAAFKTQFGNESKWADDTAKLLKSYGFNGTAA